MFEKCIRWDSTFVPAYIGLSKMRIGTVNAGILLKKALTINAESPIVRLEYADWLYARRKFAMPCLCMIKGNIIPSFADMYLEAYEHYMVGVPHKSSIQLSFVTGALKALRNLGYIERMYQVMLR